jgi:hypothetical protein
MWNGLISGDIATSQGIHYVAIGRRCGRYSAQCRQGVAMDKLSAWKNILELTIRRAFEHLFVEATSKSLHDYLDGCNPRRSYDPPVGILIIELVSN